MARPEAETRHSPFLLEAVLRRTDQIRWVLHAVPGTWWYVLTTGRLPDPVVLAELLAGPSVGPFPTQEAAADRRVPGAPRPSRHR